MLELEVLVRELLAVDGLAACSRPAASTGNTGHTRQDEGRSGYGRNLMLAQSKKFDDARVEELTRQRAYSILSLWRENPALAAGLNSRGSRTTFGTVRTHATKHRLGRGRPKTVHVYAGVAPLARRTYVVYKSGSTRCRHGTCACSTPKKRFFTQHKFFGGRPPNTAELHLFASSLCLRCTTGLQQ